METVGIYIKTFNRDQHHALALVASVRRHAPGVPVLLIAGDRDFRARIKGVDCLVGDHTRDSRLVGYYGKLRCFLGPFERFVYMDADMIALEGLESLLEDIRKREGDFFVTCMENKIRRQMDSAGMAERRKIVARHVGDLELIREFDNDYQPDSVVPFNSGMFAATKTAINMDRAFRILDRAICFEKRRGATSLQFTRQGLFMSDQGFINYLCAKLGVPVSYVADLWVWGGGWQTISTTPKELGVVAVHWAGCRRPGLFRRGVPYEHIWRDAYIGFHRARLGVALGSVLAVFDEVIREFRRIN